MATYVKTIVHVDYVHLINQLVCYFVLRHERNMERRIWHDFKIGRDNGTSGEHVPLNLDLHIATYC